MDGHVAHVNTPPCDSLGERRIDSETSQEGDRTMR